MDRVAVDFLLRLMADKERGSVKSLGEYLIAFPGFEEVVAREYLALTDGDVSAPDAAPTDSWPTRVGGPSDSTGPSHELIGHYRVVRELGRGGQGVVYQAFDTRLGRAVALKVLEHGPARADDLLVRFRREAQVGSRLDHPGICGVYDVGLEKGRAWIAMRFIEGDSLSKVIGARDGRPADRREIPSLLSLIEGVSRALHVAHEAGIIHRDVKPGNIMVTPDGEPVILDFGLARDQESDLPSLTATGDVFGTPGYISPEQLSGLRTRVDRRTDVYSLGVTLFVALTGKLPFDAPTTEALCLLIRSAAPPDVRKLNANVSEDMRVVLDTALEKDLERRYRDAAAFADDLRRVQENRPILARPAGAWLRLRRWSQRNPAMATSLGTLLVALVAGLLLTLWFLGTERGLRRESQGRFDEIMRLSDARMVSDLLEREATELWPIEASVVDRIDRWHDDLASVEANLAVHEASLLALRRRGTRLPGPAAQWTFATTPDAWRHAILAGLLVDLSTLSERRAEVARRRALGGTVIRRTITEKTADWQRVAQDVVADPRFDRLSPAPQPGLVPLHRDPRSGFWEFLVADSGEAPTWDDDAETWRVSEATGVVLVLLPGGEFQMGAQADDAGRPGWVAGADPKEAPVHGVRLAPFLISKYELTQGQYAACFRQENPSFYRPGSTGDAKFDASERTLALPVEQVDWHEAAEACRRLGLALPTEAQWEYACRAGSSTPWYFGGSPEDLDNKANFDGRELRLEATAAADQTIDRHPLTAKVGSYPANDFGLHDTHGNVWEWCRDNLVPYDTLPELTDGLRIDANTESKLVVRGGSFLSQPRRGRSSARLYAPAALRNKDVGVRPMRALGRP